MSTVLTKIRTTHGKVELLLPFEHWTVLVFYSNLSIPSLRKHSRCTPKTFGRHEIFYIYSQFNIYVYYQTLFTLLEIWIIMFIYIYIYQIWTP